MTSTAELTRRRYSCRRFLERPIEQADRGAIDEFLASLTEGPLGNRCRFSLVAAASGDSDALKGLGTYGFIKGATGFIVGAVRPAPKDMEDYGYCLERAVLEATGLGLGTCWLGGTFTKSSFAARIAAGEDEIVPAVIAIGYPAKNSEGHWIRRSAKGGQRQPHERLFFDRRPGSPLDMSTAGSFAEALEVVRWAPSASNKQPWRFVRDDKVWHLYLERTSNPNKKGMVHSIIKMADVQRLDMGIAMCHFQLAAEDAGVTGGWDVETPEPGSELDAEAAAAGWEYIASWVSD